MYISPYFGREQDFLEKFSMIFASSENGMIGKDNKLLWHLPNDLKRFKQLTSNKIVVMGKNTYLSLPNGALPNRLNIVLCNDDKEFLEKEEKINKPNTGLVKLSSIEKVFNFIHNFEMNPAMPNIDTNEYFIIGGGVIYNLFLPYIQKVYLTLVDVNIDGDTQMPYIEKYEWDELECEEYPKDEKHEYSYTFFTLKKSK
jgi:dihydrofolate reductase